MRLKSKSNGVDNWTMLMQRSAVKQTGPTIHDHPERIRNSARRAQNKISNRIPLLKSRAHFAGPTS
jgi:hypothetical protein